MVTNPLSVQAMFVERLADQTIRRSVRGVPWDELPAGGSGGKRLFGVL